MISEKDLQRIMSKVKKKRGRGCWVWIGAGSALNKPQIEDGGKSMSARAFIYKKFYRDPEGDPVLATCLTKNCVNPEHLSLKSLNPHRAPSELVSFLDQSPLMTMCDYCDEQEDKPGTNKCFAHRNNVE